MPFKFDIFKVQARQSIKQFFSQSRYIVQAIFPFDGSWKPRQKPDGIFRVASVVTRLRTCSTSSISQTTPADYHTLKQCFDVNKFQ